MLSETSLMCQLVVYQGLFLGSASAPPSHNSPWQRVPVLSLEFPCVNSLSDPRHKGRLDELLFFWLDLLLTTLQLYLFHSVWGCRFCTRHHFLISQAGFSFFIYWIVGCSFFPLIWSCLDFVLQKLLWLIPSLFPSLKQTCFYFYITLVISMAFERMKITPLKWEVSELSFLSRYLIINKS